MSMVIGVFSFGQGSPGLSPTFSPTFTKSADGLAIETGRASDRTNSIPAQPTTKHSFAVPSEERLVKLFAALNGERSLEETIYAVREGDPNGEELACRASSLVRGALRARALMLRSTKHTTSTKVEARLCLLGGAARLSVRNSEAIFASPSP
jgi:hypothetical protein